MLASPEFRAMLLRSVLVTLALLLGFWLVALWAFRRFVAEGLLASGWLGGSPWLATLVTAAAGLLLAGAALALAMPLLVFVSRLFLPDIAGHVRAAAVGALGAARETPATALADAARFAGRSLLVHLVLLPLYLVPLVNLIVFATANAYLLGRHHFVTAAQQSRSREAALALYRRNRLVVLGAGFLVFLVSAVPLANLIAPSFAPLLMLRLEAHLAGTEAA